MARAVKAVRVAAWVVGGLLAIVILLLALLHTPPARRYALNKGIEILGRQGIRFSGADFDYNLLELTARLNNVEVRSPQAPELPPLLIADSLDVDLSLRKIISGAYHIEDATVRNPQIHLVIDKDGRDNIPRPPKKEPSDTETDYLIDKAIVEGGSLRIEDRRQALDATLPLERLDIDGDPLTEKHTIGLRTRSGGTVAFSGRTLPMTGVSANAVLDEKSADVKRLEFGLGDSKLTLTGRIEDFDSPRVDLRANSTLQLAPLIEFAGVKQTARGTVQVGVTATGPLREVKADAQIEGDNLTLDRLRDVDLKTELTYDTARSRVRFHSLNVVSPSGTVRGTADIALNEAAGTSTANLAASGLDLLRLSTTFDAPVKIASRGDAKIAARWPGLKVEEAAGDATVHLTAYRAAGRDVLPLQGRLNARTAGNRIVIGIPGVQTMNANASGNVVLVNRSTLNGKLRIVSDDLAATMQAADAFLGRKPMDTPIGGRAEIVADLGGTVQRPAVQASIDAPELNVGQLQGATLRAHANYDGRDLTLKDTVLDWRGQTLTASGTVGRTLDLTASTQNVRVESILAGLNMSDVPASGNLQIDARVTGSSKSPNADVRLTGSDLAAYKEPLGTLEATAQLTGDLLTVQELRLDKPQPGGAGTLRASGTYNLENKQFTVDAKSDNLQLTQLTLPDGTRVRGNVSLNADVQGTTEDPAGTIQLAATSLIVGKNEIGELTTTAKVANGTADIDAAAPAYNLTTDAQIGIKAPYPATVEVRAKNTDLASLPVNVPVKGTVTAVVRGTGEISNWQQGQATAEVAALDLNYNGQPLRSEGPLVASYQNQRLTIDRATLIARDSRVQLQGTLPLEATAGEGEIKLSAKLDFPSLTEYLPEGQNITARGTALIDGTISGTLKRIDPNVTIALNDGYFLTPQLNPPLSGVNLQGHIRNGALELASATASLGPADFTASGTIPFGLLPADLPVEFPRRQGPATLTAELRDLDLGTLQALPDKAEGLVSARLDLTAARPELEALSGTLTFPDLRLEYGSLVLNQQGTTTVAFANGVARVEQFVVSGPGTELAVFGTAGLTGKRPLDIVVDATSDAAILRAFSEDLRAEGNAQVHVALTGTVEQPQANGFVQLADASLSMTDPRIGIDGLDMRVELAGTQATVTRLNGVLNGGDFAGGGSLNFAGGQLSAANLKLKADDVYLDYPEGLKTISDIDLTVTTGRNNNVVVGGDVTVEEGGFTDDLYFDRGLLAALDSSRGVDLTEERSPLLERVQLNVGVRTVNPVIVDNNLAEAELRLNVRVLGNPSQLGLSGRAEVEEGGEIRLQERRYLVERGIILFTSDRRIEPNLDILATTNASGYEIRLQISGEPGKTETTLTSDPPLPEPSILALLITGRTLEDLQGEEFEVARNQVFSYLTGRVGSTLGRGIQSATGLSTVRIEPNLIAAETDPSARLTVGQNITRNLELIYSMDLRNSSDQIYVAEYDLTRRFTTRGVRQEDGSYRFDFRHDLRFGGVPQPGLEKKRVERRIAGVNIIGEQYFPEKQIADKFGVEAGKRYDFFKVRKGVDRVNKMHAKEGLLESRVRLRRQQEGNLVTLNLHVAPGPVVDFVYEGISVSGNVKDQVREIWHEGVFDTQRAEESVEAIRGWLMKEEKRLRPQIEYRIAEAGAGRKRIIFDIQPGPVFRDVELAFEGAKAFEQDKLRDVIEDQKLTKEVYTAPGRVTEVLQAFYREMGYLSAAVAEPRYELDPAKGTGKVVFPVTEGPLYKIGQIAFTGNTVYNRDQLLEEVPLQQGEPYRPRLRQNALERLREAYWDIGFNDVEAEAVTQPNKEAGTVDLTFRIAEGRQAVVASVAVEGMVHTSENLVRSQIALEPGDILDFERLSEARRNLYKTGAFSLVEIVREEVGADDESTRARRSDAEKPMSLVVRVHEIQPWQLRYGGFFDTERGPGGIVDVANRNMLGSARVLGLRTRYDKQLREARLYFSQPNLLRFPLRTIVSPFLRQERNPATKDADPFNVDRIGFSVQQEAVFNNRYILNYGYRIERSRTFDPEDTSDLNPFNITLRIAGLTATLSRDSRDDILDATRGSFLSQAFQYSPSILGSQIRFTKYFGQYFHYLPLQSERIELFTNEVLRPRLVYAAGIRVGLANGLGGQEIPLSERFFAGGATTVRGFEQNSIGPVGFDRVPQGGNAMLVINNELRFPLFSIFDGAGFVDIGNVYPTVSDLSLTDIRKTAGPGLRVRTPWFLIRFDYGFKLDRKPGESIGRFFFSIGQAF